MPVAKGSLGLLPLDPTGTAPPTPQLPSLSRQLPLFSSSLIFPLCLKRSHHKNIFLSLPHVATRSGHRRGQEPLTCRLELLTQVLTRVSIKVWWVPSRAGEEWVWVSRTLNPTVAAEPGQ